MKTHLNNWAKKVFFPWILLQGSTFQNICKQIKSPPWERIYEKKAFFVYFFCFQYTQWGFSMILNLNNYQNNIYDSLYATYSQVDDVIEWCDNAQHFSLCSSLRNDYKLMLVRNLFIILVEMAKILVIAKNIFLLQASHISLYTRIVSWCEW